MAVRDRMTASHQSVESVREVVRQAQSKTSLAPPVAEFNEEADDYMDNDLTVRKCTVALGGIGYIPYTLSPGIRTCGPLRLGTLKPVTEWYVMRYTAKPAAQ